MMGDRCGWGTKASASFMMSILMCFGIMLTSLRFCNKKLLEVAIEALSDISLYLFEDPPPSNDIIIVR